MEHFFGHDWKISPAGGATGNAFYAQHEDQRLFLKRNSSPFLAVLSAEGIVPKLVWTRRMENGDVITAQQWLNGRELKAAHMNDERVAIMLKKIHSSKPLLAMLTRIGKSPLQPETLLQEIELNMDAELKRVEAINHSFLFLNQEVLKIQFDEKMVCHGDVNHNNWLLTDDNQLYLIDWDEAIIGDPAMDLGMLLYGYIPKDQWPNWLERYGLHLTDDLKLRMKWYVIAQTLSSIQWHKDEERFQEMKRELDFLEKILLYYEN